MSKMLPNTMDRKLWKAVRKLQIDLLQIKWIANDAHLRVPELEKVCLKQCENDLLECVIYCGNDSPCLSACMRLAQECEDSKLEFSPLPFSE